MRKLSREYGWSALGVYLLLSALDFPFCFLGVRLLGVERIGHYEHAITEAAKDALDSVLPAAITTRKATDEGQSRDQVQGQTETEVLSVGAVCRGNVGAEQGRSKAHNTEEASIWTQLALAYALHKSLIFFRVPLTAAVTPNVVKTFRRWGWDIGVRRPKA